ncbi:MAG TPA: hypothetical protein VMI33_10410 [Streptosporangiaceae bacterium]|nr:hypothetical protein [Streptosporangiaceae bacterium]
MGTFLLEMLTIGVFAQIGVFTFWLNRRERRGTLERSPEARYLAMKRDPPRLCSESTKPVAGHVHTMPNTPCNQCGACAANWSRGRYTGHRPWHDASWMA